MTDDQHLSGLQSMRDVAASRLAAALAAMSPISATQMRDAEALKTLIAQSELTRNLAATVGELDRAISEAMTFTAATG
jgi:hypothetical protein